MASDTGCLRSCLSFGSIEEPILWRFDAVLVGASVELLLQGITLQKSIPQRMLSPSSRTEIGLGLASSLQFLETFLMTILVITQSRSLEASTTGAWAKAGSLRAERSVRPMLLLRIIRGTSQVSLLFIKINACTCKRVFEGANVGSLVDRP